MLKKKTVGACISVFLGLLMLVSALLIVSSNGYYVRAQEIKKDFDTINSIVLKPSLSSDVRDYKDELNIVYKIGIGGVPLLLEKVSNSKTFGAKESLYMEGVLDLLSIDRNKMRIQYSFGEIKSDYEYFLKLLKNAKTEVPRLLNSNLSTSDKMKALSDFGVLSIPYIMNDAGDIPSEYSTFLTLINLDVTPAERTARYRNEDIESRSFDQKAWLSENKYDLKILSDYVKKAAL